MDKNRIKRFLDAIIIILFVCIIVLFNLEQNIFTTIGLIITILIEIVNCIFWRCPKCNRYLPQNSFFHYVLCCPYCGTNIEMNKTRKK